MKGPYERLKYDFRRHWECARCHRKARTPGAVTSLSCSCSEEAGHEVWMQLVYDGPQVTRRRWSIEDSYHLEAFATEPAARVADIDHEPVDETSANG